MAATVRHSHFGAGHVVQKSGDGELSLVVWDIEKKSWFKHGWYDLTDREFTVEKVRKVYDGRRILSALR